jgi:hypothetical protein
MIDITILETEATSRGDVAEVILDKSVVPAIGMILIDEDSQTWEVTAMLHDKKRSTEDSSTVRWLLHCQPVNTEKPLHPGPFKLMH